MPYILIYSKTWKRGCRYLTKYLIHGGSPLHGTIQISGAKNAAVAIIPAALLVDGVCRIENVPQISDVTLILQILRELGANVRTINRTTVEVDCSNIRNRQVPYELARKIRASYYLVGALLSRFGWAEVPLPGGCDLGGRPIDQHIKGFVAMGAEVDVRSGLICARVPGGARLSGGQVYLDMVSVGATMNIMLAATLADGMTIIENAAKEPHIVDLANFLNSMGADIRGAGTDVIKVRGVARLKGGSYSIIPDQIEAGTYMAAVAAAGAKLIIRERLLTEGTQQAKTDFSVQLDGEDSGADIISRSVARGKSRQQYRSRIVGNNRCTGHSECDAIIGEERAVDAAPALIANHGDAALIHEAAIGKIAGEQLLKLRTLGLTEEEAEARIVAGFLK